MKTTSRLLSGLLLLALSLPAFAAHCPKDMKKIDAALAQNPALSAGDLATVRDLRASGEAKHKSGNHSGSIDDLHQAMQMLGLEVE